MIKNILKKFIVLLGLSFVLIGFNFTKVTAEDAPVPAPIECVAPQILNEAKDACVDVVVVPEKLKEQVVIRNGDVILYDGFYELPESGIISIPDKDGVAHDINARSALAILYGIDSTSDNFSISTLEYSGVYDSLYMKCLTPSGGEILCDNWQYVVNDSYPYVGMDKNILSGNEKIYIYFGQQNRVLLNKNLIKDNEELNVTAEKYDYEHNLWLSRSGVTVGVTKPDPANPWTPNDEIQKKVDDVTGIAIFSSVPEGEYNVGIKEDYYWPTEKLVVTKFVPENNGGGGGSNTPLPPKTFSTSKAFEFLSFNQKSDGSFGAPMYTDWVAIASKAGDNADLKLKLTNYLKSNPIDGGVVTDYERRAMALMALGINPYNGTEVNYIKKITDSFDGVQFGDASLVNDDIFALIVLKNAGYTGSDEMINKDVNYIVSKQSGGSWGSIDMTGAGIQALRGFGNISGVSSSISSAENYLVSSQGTDGGFENNSSTSWALQALIDANSVSKATDYLASGQQSDGGLENTIDETDVRVWSTAYAIPAVLHKTWSSILDNFSKQEVAPAPASSPSLIQEIKSEIVAPAIVEEEKKDLEVLPKVEDKKIIKPIVRQTTKPIIKTSATTNTKIEKPIGSPLSASAIGVSESNNNFLSIVHNVISKIKAPFVWLLVKLGF
ncbi:hypothetical protein A2467_01830 [Candidatus Nomurabacteria bacterium RIFOXYC2_FULL_36_8]|nr:MAG: hypothetical protein UR97_C0005G0028 [Candidatus Nomurabacteria bacterium GW2011_GWE2_36_115]KKP93743.1 MAG: hypothetical protein US00_C0005G0028 [Candidatus Nomurabacteria bacterium GW2011_GWF2_36_126]KKP97188.1 MAG: hypothetical protein US04_C0001G0691 [Candidatus Nomurabacteria bacterium GW2011_GWD2_36_14]KKP99205.1 MAG: hypothetical protein US08_C0002G0028 [Candidatus Nomurabacteria bacterium GW2011_GWF2_36_19]KKQ05852.1 MAG: hypothetical protein US17_C0001G0030 [Candidatus Nomuraba